MKNIACMAIALFSGVGCTSPGDDMTTGMPSASASITTDGHAAKVRARTTGRKTERLLGADERRVVVFVVPGDALVEVDGQTVDRRDGVVELVGKVGETRRLRAWKGDKSTEARLVVIEETGANPSFVDVNEAKPKAKATAAKEKAATFDLTE